MFATISWSDYFTAIIITALIYYLVVLYIYYRNELVLLVKSKRNLPRAAAYQHPIQSYSLFEETNTEFSHPPIDSKEHVVYAFMDELTAFFEGTKKTKIIKEQLLYSLQRVLRKYPSLKDSEYKQSLTNVIVSECEHICSLHLTADDVVRMWMAGE